MSKPSYTPEELINKTQVLQSQTLLHDFLTAESINRLIQLFENTNNNTINIINILEDERRKHGLNSVNTSFKSEIYGTNLKKSSFFLGLQKNNKDFIHLTIHLVPQSLNKKQFGMIHISKDIYTKNTSITIPKRDKYALIKIEKPIDRPNSLHFSIPLDGYTSPGAPNSAKYDPEIAKEMNAIIAILNRLFDETDTEMYIGDNTKNNITSKKLIPIHNKTNNVLEDINTHTTLVSRKNKGVKMLPNFTSDAPINIIRKNNKNNTKKQRNKRQTRKVRK